MSDYERLKQLFSEMGGVLVAYSGGVDSTLLAKTATDVLGDKALCVLIESCLVPGVEADEARQIAQEFGLNLETISVDVLGIDHLPDNKPQRCYYCKHALFSQLVEIARERGMPYVVDGSNADDETQFRPGSKAAEEVGVRSPFKELGLTKEQIRSISRDIGLPTWNKPSYACLASRVPYGIRLTPNLLKQIEAAEGLLRKLGFSQFRVRHHGDTARIEMIPGEMEKAMVPEVRKEIVQAFSELGYKHSTLDLAGYRSGSFDEALEDLV